MPATITTTHPTATTKESSSLSEYERSRAVNIERNNARLVALGLLTADEAQRSNDAAWKRNTTDNTTHDKDASTKKRKKGQLRQPGQSKRKSLRVQGRDPEKGPQEGRRLVDDEPTVDDNSNIAHVRQTRVETRRRARADVRVTEAERTRAARENRTATYAHCLHRVRTMTDRALHSRIRAVERAAGKHCVVKMAVFKSCLQDEGLWELADAAADALERLKALQPPPASDES